MHKHAKQERVDGRADGLVEEELGERVADVELGLDEPAFAGFAVELFFVVGRGGLDGLWRGRGCCFGWERCLEEFLP